MPFFSEELCAWRLWFGNIVGFKGKKKSVGHLWFNHQLCLLWAVCLHGELLLINSFKIIYKNRPQTLNLNFLCSFVCWNGDVPCSVPLRCSERWKFVFCFPEDTKEELLCLWGGRNPTLGEGICHPADGIKVTDNLEMFCCQG